MIAKRELSSFSGSVRDWERTCGVMEICCPVRRETGLREPVCLARRWEARTDISGHYISYSGTNGDFGIIKVGDDSIDQWCLSARCGFTFVLGENESRFQELPAFPSHGGSLRFNSRLRIRSLVEKIVLQVHHSVHDRTPS